MACPNHPTPLQEMHYRIRIQLGGGIWKGVQAGDRELGLEPLILFDDPDMPPERRSTMCLKSSAVSSEAVRAAIQAKRLEFQKFEAFADKAVNRVFRYFGQKSSKHRLIMQDKYGTCPACHVMATPGHLRGTLHNNRARIVAGLQCGESITDMATSLGISTWRMHTIVKHVGGRPSNEPEQLAEAA